MAAPQQDLPGRLKLRSGGRASLSATRAGRTLGWDEAQARAASQKLAPKLAELQYRLYADGRYGVLVVLQAFAVMLSRCNPRKMRVP